jgi:hypothetical protein
MTTVVCRVRRCEVTTVVCRVRRCEMTTVVCRVWRSGPTNVLATEYVLLLSDFLSPKLAQLFPFARRGVEISIDSGNGDFLLSLRAELCNSELSPCVAVDR